MDRATITSVIFIIASAAIAYLGAAFGDVITADLPGGKATGVVAGVTILMGLFVTSYNTLKGKSTNKLDNVGLNNLLEIHFGSVAHGLVFVFDQAVKQLEKDPDSYSTEALLNNVTRVVDQSRSKLAPFSTNKITNIPTFLDNYLSQEDLKSHLIKLVEITKTKQPVEVKQKLIFQYIQKVQTDLLRIICSSKHA